MMKLNNRNFKYPDTAAYDSIMAYFKTKNIKLEDIASITYKISCNLSPTQEKRPCQP